MQIALRASSKGCRPAVMKALRDVRQDGVARPVALLSHGRAESARGIAHAGRFAPRGQPSQLFFFDGKKQKINDLMLAPPAGGGQLTESLGGDLEGT